MVDDRSDKITGMIQSIMPRTAVSNLGDARGQILEDAKDVLTVYRNISIYRMWVRNGFSLKMCGLRDDIAHVAGAFAFAAHLMITCAAFKPKHFAVDTFALHLFARISSIRTFESEKEAYVMAIACLSVAIKYGVDDYYGTIIYSACDSLGITIKQLTGYEFTILDSIDWNLVSFSEQKHVLDEHAKYILGSSDWTK